MYMRRNAESVGCLLIGETMRMRVLSDKLSACGVAAVSAENSGDLLTAAQEGLRAARRSGSACIAAEGEM
jgi:hypothetical protein